MDQKRNAITPESLRWIVCPVCHHSLQLETESLLCLGCSRRYPIVDGIPVLLAERSI